MELKDLENLETSEIEAKVYDIMECCKPNERFIFSVTATPINVPLALKTSKNMIAMLNSASKYGK